MKHGYELIHDFLTKEEHEKYLKTCNRVYNNALQNPNNEHYTWYEDNHLNKIDGAVKFEREFLELASHPILVKRAKEILGIDTNVDIFISDLIKDRIIGKFPFLNFYINQGLTN